MSNGIFKFVQINMKHLLYKLSSHVAFVNTFSRRQILVGIHHVSCHLGQLSSDNSSAYTLWKHTVKHVANGHSQIVHKLVFKTNFRLIQVKSIEECSKWEHSAKLSTFIKLPFVIKIFVVSYF